MFTGFYYKMIYQFNCFKTNHKIYALRNYNPSVSGRHTSLYHCSIQEVYLSIENTTLYMSQSMSCHKFRIKAKLFLLTSCINNLTTL